MTTQSNISLPDAASIEAELLRVQQKHNRSSAIRVVVIILVVVAAVAVLLATTVFPVLRIRGNSMSPTTSEGDIVITMKADSAVPGDIVALSYGNKTLVKRVIATGGQKVDIDASGNVYINGEFYREPYLQNGRSLGECTISLPCIVPEGQYFVMGDNRAVSQDSRVASIGCITGEQLMGRAVFRIWPLTKFGGVE